MRECPRTSAWQPNIRKVDTQGFHQVQNFELFGNGWIAHRGRLKAVSKGLVIEQHRAFRLEGRTRNVVPVVDKFGAIQTDLPSENLDACYPTPREGIVTRHARPFTSLPAAKRQVVRYISKLRMPPPLIQLRTERLILCPYREQDIPALVRLLGDREVAATTLRIPHPYTEADARAFLKAQESPASKFGMFEVSSGDLVGGIGLGVEERHHHAELGYWVGVPYWGKGYATEAAREMLRHGF